MNEIVFDFGEVPVPQKWNGMPGRTSAAVNMRTVYADPRQVDDNERPEDVKKSSRCGAGRSGIRSDLDRYWAGKVVELLEDCCLAR